MQCCRFKILRILILFTFISNSYGLYDGQPKIISKDGNLIIESAKDKNITLRIVGNGRIFANGVDLLTNRATAPSIAILDNNVNKLDTQDVKYEDQIKRILNILLFNITRLENVTIQQGSQLRRLQNRASRVNRDLLNLVSNLRVNKCEEGPCKNGGTCIPIYNGFLCQCTPAWQGPTCDTDVDECVQFVRTPNLGCQNDAWCDNTPGGYSCRCKSGFFGAHCTEKEKDCLKSSARELCDHGACLNTKTGIECICDQGWKKNEVTGACTVDINECEANVNPCHSSCINVPGTFYCGPCPAGFTGNGFVCKDVDECQTNNGGCSPHARCINNVGSYGCGRCPPGYIGDGRSCETSETNACRMSGFCSRFADCRMISGVPICTCKTGYVGNGQVCRLINITNPCSSNPCANHSRCELSSDPSGFKCIAYASCLRFMFACRNGGTCVSKGMTTECRCPRGFKGRYCETVDRGICNKVLVDDTGSLDLMNYAPDSNCYYIIQTTEAKILNVTINKFNLKNSSDCSSNFVQMHNGKNSAASGFGRYCGTKIPMDGQFYTSHNFLYVWFKTDSSPSNTSLGFQLSWTSIDPICGGEFTFENNLKSAGIISSPGWPGLSPPNRDCSWNFMAPHGKRLAFRVLEIKLGGTEAECGDYFEIRAGDENTKLCSSTVNPSVFEATSNTAQINFHSDQYSTDSSFQLHYEIVDGIPDCGGIFQGSRGIIKSPKTKYPTFKSITCQYLIRQPIGARVMIEFETFEIPGLYNCSTSKSYFNIEVYDGNNENAPILMRKCHSEIPDPIKSVGNTLMLRYRYIDGFPHSVYNGFTARYSLLCDMLFTNSTGEIKSPGFPNPYVNYINCIYEIQAPMHHIISLSIESFSLSYRKTIGCDIEMDNIEIFAGVQNSSRFCESPGNLIISKNNYMKIVFHSVNNFNKAEGFRFRYQFENIGCGGVLTDLHGTISTINTRMTNTFCEWIIKAPPDYSIVLKYTEIKFNNGASKCDNSLRQFENFTNGDSVETKICNVSQAKDVTSSAGVITIIQNIISPLGYEEGFTADYEISDTVCGGTFTAAYGELKTPGYPKEYPNNIDCTWLIVAPDGHQIELKPLNFSLEMISDNCGEDYLEIRNGKSEDSPLIGKFCGKNIPSRIPSQANHLLIKFHADYSIRMPGFYINYEQTATGCGGNINSFEGSIHSPHYPDITQNGALCNWLITVSAGSTITAVITIDVDSADVCDKNQILIFDGDSVKNKKIPIVCKNDTFEKKLLIQTIYSTSNKLFVRFETSSEEPAKFLLTYKTNCTTILTDMRGEIESPNFPNNYPNNLLCHWTILSKKSKSITVIVSHLQLEGTLSDCYYDRLTVKELKNNNTLQEHSLCKEKTKTIVSDGDSIKIIFSSDYSNSEKGFRIEYFVETCGDYYKSPKGVIQSLNSPYSNNIYCMWTIETDYGSVIQLNVSENVGLENCDWINEGLLISNDKFGNDIITKSCSANNFKVVSNGRLMYIIFQTNEFHKQKYFRASYNVYKQNCGGALHVETNELQLKSPNYPQFYPSDTDCEWIVTSLYSKRFQIDLQYIDIEKSEQCKKDYLEIFDITNRFESTSILKYCGDNIPTVSQFTSSTNRMVVKFHSDNSTESSGFKIIIKRLCGANIEGSRNGLITKKNEEIDCEWNIKSIDEEKLNLKFSKLVCICGNVDDVTCENTKGIQVYEDNILRASFCKRPPHIITSSGDSFKIYAREGVQSIFAIYSQFEKACGGVFNLFKGQIASPQYPTPYKAGFECETTIRASKGNMIQLIFYEFDLINSDHCNEDYVEIREGGGGKLLDVLCGNNVVNKTFELYEIAWIKFRSAENSPGAKGFLAHYEYKRDVEILTEKVGTKGTIINPPLENIKEESDPFSWRIITDLGKAIIFEFKEYSQGLKFYDGFDETSSTKDIEHSPSTIISTSNFAYIISENVELYNFRIEWKVVDRTELPENKTKCGETIEIFQNVERNISSTNYPKLYESNTHCEWIFTPKVQADHVAISLYAADLEAMSNCYADYLKIYSGEDLAIWAEEKKVCNLTYKATPYFVIHGTPFIKLVFHSDSFSEGPGFTAMLASKCGGYLTQPAGTIDTNSMKTSDNSCAWKIKVQRGRKIEFKFDFNYETLFYNSGNEKCEDGYAILRNGIDEDGPIMSPGRICSQVDIENVQLITMSNVAYVKFQTKPYKHITWKLTYQEQNECGDEIHLNVAVNSTKITSPNYPQIPHPYAECIWTFTSPPATTMNVEFTEFITHGNRIICLNEYVQIRDGSTNLARQLERYCKKPNKNIAARSSSNTLWIKYYANTSEPLNTFVATVSIAKCFTLVDGYYYGEIKSLNYPAKGAYQSNSECIYSIQTANFFRINITIEDLHLPFNSSNLNKSDHLQIIADDGTTKDVVMLYGNDTRKYLELFGNIQVKFFTYNAQTQYRGFKLTYRRYNTCFKNIHAEEGELVARKNSRKFFNCRWQITVPKGRIVRAKVTEIQFTQTRSSNHKIRFFNDFNGKSKIIEATNATVDFIKSTDNRMLIRLDGGYPSIVSSVKITFDSDGLSECIGDFNLSTNVLKTSYMSVSNLPSKYYCLSNIVINDGETIGFRVDNLLLVGSDGIGSPISFKTAYSNYKSISGNITNYDLGISKKGTTLEIHNSGEFKIFNFQISTKKHKCGSEYLNYVQLNKFTLPTNISSNYGRIDCVWTISLRYYFGDQNMTFVSNFINSDCTKEYLTIYNGNAPSDVQVQKLCGNKTFNFLPDGKYVLMHYHAEEFSAISKVNITTNKIKECSREITPSLRGASLEFTGRDYENNLECIWNYRTKDGFSVALEFFGRFFIPSNPNCTEDYLEIKTLTTSNKWITYPRYCGRDLPKLINSTNSVYEIKFRSDSKTIGDGFSMKFIDFCGGIFNVNENVQTIKNPSDWHTTRYQIKCNYTLVTDTDGMIMVKFNKFKVGSDPVRQECYYTKMSVFYEKNYEIKKIGEYCDANPLKYEIKSKKFITLVYESQLYNDEFSFDFYLENCGGNITTPKRIHSAVDEDGINYPTQMDCRWDIVAPTDKDIAIHFNYLVYENNYKCQDDYIAIYNSTEPKEEFRKLLICGNHTGATIPVTKTSNRAVIITKSDSYGSYEGFSADISFIPKCDKYLNLTVEKTSHIEFNYYYNNGKYENNLDCHISFVTNSGFQISIEFMDFDIKDCSNEKILNSTDNKNCNCDYLEIFDSSNIHQRSLGRFCGNQSPKIIQSSKQNLTMRFVSDGMDGGAGFKYEVKRKENICGVQTIDLFNKKEYTLLSPNYPEYPPNAYCEWHINTNESFLIKFDKLDLEDPSPETGLCNDYVEIVRPYTNYGSVDQDIVFCSNKVPMTINIYVSSYTTEQPRIIFKSNSEIEKTGFKLILKDTGICNLTLSELSGYVEQPIKSNCRFNIGIPESQTIALYFEIRIINFIAKNCSQTIKIFDTKSNEMLQQICATDTYMSSHQIFLKTTKVTIEADTTESSKPFDIDLFYMGNTNGLGCGGEIYGIRGVLSSPMYPNNFRNYTECRWTITGPFNSIIGIGFRDLDMGSKKNCANDNLQFIDVYPTHTKPREQFCGGDDPSYFDSKTNKLMIVYKRTVNFDGRGWRLNFDARSAYKTGTIIV